MSSDKIIYSVTSEVRGSLYRKILEYANERSARFLLVQRSTVALNRSGLAVIADLLPFLVSQTECTEWPGTKLLWGQEATIYRFDLAPESIEILCNAVTTLYDWRQPELPEDLCILRNDDTAWLISIAHEDDAYFHITEEEKIRLEEAIPELAQILKQ